MRRVAYVTPLYFDEESYLGGGERYPLNLAKAVVRTGDYKVNIVSYGNVPSTRSTSLTNNVTLTVLPAARGATGLEPLSWEITSAIRSADLVHIHQMFSRPSEVAVMVAKLLGKPVCATDHGGVTSSLGRSLGMLELVDRITCYSDFGGSLLHTTTNVDVIRGGVDDDFFSPAPCPPRRSGIMYVGRFLPHKGIDRLIAALPPDIPLAVCGRPYHSEYYKLLRILAAGKDVEFVTDVDDVQLRDRYRRAMAVVLPSVYRDCFGVVQPWPELMGFSLLEGMACGSPAICSRVGGMPEYVEHDVTGFVFDELGELSGYLERLAGDADLVQRLGLEALARVRQSYGLSSSGAAMRNVYDQLLGGQAATT
jgi:glycosyltransferase involved in cell wall biosynthesis